MGATLTASAAIVSLSDGLTPGVAALPSVNVYRVGQQPIISAQFSDPDSNADPVDPISGYTQITPPSALALIRLPDGSEITPTLTKSGFLYTASLPVLRMSGTCWYRVYSPAGVHCGAGESFFRVRDQRA